MSIVLLPCDANSSRASWFMSIDYYFELVEFIENRLVTKMPFGSCYYYE